MTRIYQADDSNERFADSDMEAYGDNDRYAVLEGCAVTYDAADLTFDVAAGFVLHNGAVVEVSAQANADTIVVDGSNPRWAVIRIDNTGTADCFEGTAAATPEKPEVGDYVELAWIKPVNGDTVANSISVKLDKRIFARQAFIKGSDEASATSLGISGALYRDVTGATTIAGIDAGPTGWIQILQFDSTPQLTHNATSFILRSGADETVAAGDVKAFVCEGSGNWREIFNLAPAGAAAPTTADYLVGTAQGGLSAEIVVGTTPNGELGGTWGAITVDTTHAGSAHHAAAHTVASTGDHAQSGLTAGHVLRASSTSAFDFAQLQHTDLGGVTSDQHHAQSHTVASHSDTTATGAETETLTDGSDASALHNHTTANLNDTTATGANLTTLTDGSDASSLHSHGAITVLDSQYTAVGTDADLLEKDLMSYSIPGNTLDADGEVIRVTFWGTKEASGQDHTLRFYYDGVAHFAPSTGGQATDRWEARMLIVRTGATAQKIMVSHEQKISTGSTGGSSFQFHGTDAATLSGATIVKVTGQNAVDSVANQLTCEGMIVEHLS
jgi:hypothetical protein